MSTDTEFKLRDGFFSDSISVTDPVIYRAIEREELRQKSQIELIAPKNYLSRASREALGSFMALTSVEGYPGRRYHAGVGNIDEIEQLAIERARQMFGAIHANVQPHSGTQANQAVYFALLEPGDTVLSMELSAGGHLSHGLKSNLSGRWSKTISYSVNKQGFIDYDHLLELASRHKPKLIIVGGSSYPRAIDFESVGRIAKQVSAHVLADVAHFAGLIVGGCYPHPFPHVDVITTTTNKNLRGPRGGLILTRDASVGKLIDSAIFPGIQGGPLPEMITGKAVCFGEALKPEFSDYARTVLENARTLSSTLVRRGYEIVTGGTDTPLVVMDLRAAHLTGALVQSTLEAAGITSNRNLVPNDPERPHLTSGLRLKTSAITARGMRPADASAIGNLIADVLDRLVGGTKGNDAIADNVPLSVKELTRKFPIHPN
jgi:glycine hydroxymethyltransferase